VCGKGGRAGGVMKNQRPRAITPGELHREPAGRNRLHRFHDANLRPTTLSRREAEKYFHFFAIFCQNGFFRT